jgi:hypothetical protein
MDMTSLYPGAMLFPLSYELLPGLHPITINNLMNYSNELEDGFFAVCDIECPKELHNKFSAKHGVSSIFRTPLQIYFIFLQIMTSGHFYKFNYNYP